MGFGLSKTAKHSPIAIDFGADTIKMLQTTSDDRPNIIASAMILVPEAVRQDPYMRLQFFENAIKQAIKDHPFKGKKVICSLPAYQTLTQNMEVSKSEKDSEYFDQIKAELIEKFSVDPERMVIRWYPMTQIVKDGVTKQEVLCMAAGQEVVMGYIDMAKRCKLEVVGIHTEQFATVKTFAYLFRRGADKKADQVNMYVDIGGSTTKVTVTHCDQVKFAKTIHIGGHQMTEEYARKRQLDFSTARLERLHHAMGIVEQEATIKAPAPVSTGPQQEEQPQAQQPKEQTRGAGDIEETLEMIVDELQLCTRFHQHLYSEKPIEKLIFLGAESGHMEICHKIAKSLRIKAQLGDPFGRVDEENLAQFSHTFDKGRLNPGWAVAMGLCLSEANLT